MQQNELWLKADYKGNTGKILALKLPEHFRAKTFNDLFDYLGSTKLEDADATIVQKITLICQKARQQEFIETEQGPQPKDGGPYYDVIVKNSTGEYESLKKESFGRNITDYIIQKEVPFGDEKTVTIDLLEIIVNAMHIV